MNNFQLFTHKIFRFIWNTVFVISYPVLATFGLLFIGVTIAFSKLSSFLAQFSKSGFKDEDQKIWEPACNESDILEAKIYKQIIFGPNCYHFRRKDGIPSILEEHIFGKRVKVLSQGFLMEKWNTTDINEIPDFDICLYNPDEDQLTKLTNIKCFDWHLADNKEDYLYLKWFDGIQGGEVKVALA